MGCPELDMTSYLRFIKPDENPCERLESPTEKTSYSRFSHTVVSIYRYYSPELGKWISRDPIGERGSYTNVNLWKNWLFIDIITKAIQNIEGTPNRSNNDHTIITSLTDYKQLKILVENQINISKENILYMFCLNNPVILIDLLGLRLSAGEIAAIVYNETRSLSGAGIDDARALMMYAIINGDEKEATGGSKRPPTAPTVCKCKIKDEQDLYDSLVQLALEVLGNYYEEGEDPTGGSTHFNMRGTPSTTPFMGSPITTHSGPFNNSYTAGGLPSTGVYINTYK